MRLRARGGAAEVARRATEPPIWRNPTPPRQLHRRTILTRRPGQRGFSAADDFDSQFDTQLAPSAFEGAALTYCADLAAERLIYTVHSDAGMAAVFDSAFVFAGQLLHAEHLVSVPFERVNEIEILRAEMRPVFVFSIGRTGSTLLARALSAIGEGSVSEPDLLTQICRFTRLQQAALAPGMEAALVRACVARLSRYRGAAPLLKLRSQCNVRPLALLDSVPASRAVFMLRRRIDWALSRHRAFGESPAAIARILREGLHAIDVIATDRELPIIWFEDFVRDPAGTIGSLLQMPEPRADAWAGKLASVMAEDSQVQSILARSVLAGAAIEGDFAAGFEAAWRGAIRGVAFGRAGQAVLDRLERSPPVAPSGSGYGLQMLL